MEYCFSLSLPELARDSLNRSGKYSVEGGIISPVHDAYGKKVSTCTIVSYQDCLSPLERLAPLLCGAKQER